MADFTESRSSEAPPRRVGALVALRLLEALRDQDLPPELLEEEDTAVTLPRRLGLSEVVDRQIRTYRADVRRRVRLSDAEIRDLFHLVIRRPDAREIFFRVGHSLAGDEEARGWRRRLPKRVGLAIARSRVRRLLRALFGRRMGGFGRGAFSVEGRALFFIEADPGGDACFLMSGLCQATLEQVTGRKARVSHALCQCRGDALCRWEGVILDEVAAESPAPDAAAG